VLDREFDELPTCGDKQRRTLPPPPGNVAASAPRSRLKARLRRGGDRQQRHPERLGGGSEYTRRVGVVIDAG
jgi:hypothetical protein